MRNKIGFSLIYMVLLTVFASAQNPNGIKLNTEEAFDGYVLFENDDNTHIINNCGELVHTWTGINQTDNHTKLLENGNMLYIYDNAVYEVDWDGAIQNFVTHGDSELLLEYESVLLPSGNYLCAARRDFSPLQFQELGYDIPNTFPTRVDVIVELDRNTGEVVWEWNITDHVIQQRDPGANNYGILSENPGLISMDAISLFDWQSTESFMINSMDYNPTLDQVIISVRKLCEVMIIDHSTTTEEAKGSTGGNSGKGGDILYRWGNPINYGMGTVEDQQLFYQHNPHWLTEGPYAGQIMIYNNGLDRPDTDFTNRYSSVPIIVPPMDNDGNYIREEGAAFGPETPVLNYDGNNELGKFYSPYTSGAAWLPNDNLYITEGQSGRLLELDSEGRLVWEYFVYDHDYIFRSEKYGRDHPAFVGRDLSPKGTLETPPSEYVCSLFTSTIENNDALNIHIAHHPNNIPQVLIFNPEGRKLVCSIFDLFGRQVMKVYGKERQVDIDLNELISNTYILQVLDQEGKQSKSFKIIKI